LHTFTHEILRIDSGLLLTDSKNAAGKTPENDLLKIIKNNNTGRKKMNSLLTLLFIGGILYFMFRKGGMGCCGGHGDHNHHDSSDAKNKNRPIDRPAMHNEQSPIIDLNKADYAVIPIKSKEK
jgi:hypothetical protein